VNGFAQAVAETVGGGGRVLVPAFALGRAQEVALLCAEHLPYVDVWVDGLARDVSEVYERHPGPSGRPLDVFQGAVAPVPRGGTARLVREPRPGVVIATSGTLSGGPAVPWAQAILPEPGSAVLFVGYQAPGSVGRDLLDTGTVGLPDPVPVRARVGQYQLGAHATEDELVEIVRTVAARDVMLVHGSPAGQLALNQRLAIRGQPTVPVRRPWVPATPSDRVVTVPAAAFDNGNGFR
jgi:Cft2 family RNA processing exonuclease